MIRIRLGGRGIRIISMVEETKKEETTEVAGVEVAKEVAPTEIIEVDDSSDFASNKPSDVLDDLPKEIKDKLEKAKTDKSGKLRKKKKGSDAKVTVGKAYIRATYNNTVVSLGDTKGNIIGWASAGVAGFKGAKKSTPYAASIITRIACDKAKERGLKEVYVFVKGVGTGRESAVRALNANGLIVTGIKDVTPMPHNGCKAKKPRRV